MNEVQDIPLKMPKFASEREEADWWFSQRDVLDARFIAAADAGKLKTGRAARHMAELRAKRAAKAAEQPVQLDPVDARKASELAVQRGVEYEVLVRGLVHDALERELSVAE